MVDAPERPPEEDKPEGSLRPASPALITGWAVVGLVSGWLLHPVSERLRGTAPVISWAQPVSLIAVAGVVFWTAWQTRRALHVRRERWEPHRAVNRLVLARASALVGALVAGGYLGYALSWVGVPAELGLQRIVRSLVAVLGSGGLVAAGLLLERACRVRSDDPEP